MDSPICCDLEDCFKALADDTRQGILSLLQKQTMSAGELGEHFAITQPTLSHHLAVLRRANLVVAHRSGRQMLYQANPTYIAHCVSEFLIHIRKENRSESEPDRPESTAPKRRGYRRLE